MASIVKFPVGAGGRRDRTDAAGDGPSAKILLFTGVFYLRQEDTGHDGAAPSTPGRRRRKAGRAKPA